jgi:hypothetical protein
MNDLVSRLCAGDHPIEASVGPERTIQALRESIDRGYVHITFTETRGRTELGLTLDRARSSIDSANLENGAGRATIVGDLTLDYVKVRCIADIDLQTLKGLGHLETNEDMSHE